MIHVLASIQVKPGKKNVFLEIFKTNVPNVLQEEGCVEYSPAVDIDAGLPPQVLNENIVTIIEKWETLEILQPSSKLPICWPTVRRCRIWWKEPH